MTWTARILLVGILAVASVSLISAAIAFAAPYIAALIVLLVVGRFIYYLIDQQAEPK